MAKQRTILPGKQIDQITEIRQQCALATSHLYLIGSMAGRTCPQLQSMLYDAANRCNTTRLILSEAVLLAAADRDSLPGGKAERNPPDEHPNP